MTLQVFRTDLLRARAVSLLAEIHEWRAEYEAESLEPEYREHLDQQILFAAQCLASVLQELARRGELAAVHLRASQLGLELIDGRDRYSGFPSLPPETTAKLQEAIDNEDLPF